MIILTGKDNDQILNNLTKIRQAATRSVYEDDKKVRIENMCEIIRLVCDITYKIGGDMTIISEMTDMMHEINKQLGGDP